MMFPSSLGFVYFLCRIKINHDTHEVILEFGAVANTNVYTLQLVAPHSPAVV
jgi:hypothetical protein